MNTLTTESDKNTLGVAKNDMTLNLTKKKNTKIKNIISDKLTNSLEVKHAGFLYFAYILGYDLGAEMTEENILSCAMNEITLIKDNLKKILNEPFEEVISEIDNYCFKEKIKKAISHSSIELTRSHENFGDHYTTYFTTHYIFPMYEFDNIILTSIQIMEEVKNGEIEISMDAEINRYTENRISPQDFMRIAANIRNAARYIREKLYKRTGENTESYY